MNTIYEDMARRTGGNVYVGVVGPVRTGKSTLIKRLMEELVIPNIQDPYRRERAKDELPQSGSGRTIMTSEPKFIPEEAVEISPDGRQRLRIRFIDSVGYMIPGAVGAEENGAPRMVTTPWSDREIPLTQAAELGTKKVMQEHCCIGLVVTTDGSVTDIPREDYAEAEHRAITDMQATGKPFLTVINSREPDSPAACELRRQLRQRYGVEAMTADCQSLDRAQIQAMLANILNAFPLSGIRVWLPRWMDSLEPEHPVKAALYRGLLEQGEKIGAVGQAEEMLGSLARLEQVQSVEIRDTDLSTGTVNCVITFPESLFYRILSDRAGVEVENDAALLALLTRLSRVNQEYEKISEALSAAKSTGYGVVCPGAEDMTLQPPEVIRKNGSYGVRLRAQAPSIHMLRIDIATEISPMVGGEQQSRELVDYLAAEAPEKLWDSNIFGRSVYALVQEGLNAKLVRLPEEVREKFRGTLARIVNEGASGLVCLIL